MKIDFEHWRGAELYDEMQRNIQIERDLMIFKALNPTFSKDGSQYAYQYGELPNDCILGFGDTAHDAMVDFVKNYYNQKSITIKTA